MTRYLRRLAPLGGLVAAAVVAFSASPAGATVVCPPGHSPPSPYCKNVKPTAVTGVASGVKGTSATLNGAAGASVTGGDPTQWFFKYGTTTSYGKQTPTQTLGACQPGHTAPSPYCTTPATQGVSANVSGLTPCTTYHFQLFANNPDTPAADRRWRQDVQDGLRQAPQGRQDTEEGQAREEVQGQVHAQLQGKREDLHQEEERPSILTTYVLRDAQGGEALEEDQGAEEEGRIQDRGVREAELRQAEHHNTS